LEKQLEVAEHFINFFMSIQDNFINSEPQVQRSCTIIQVPAVTIHTLTRTCNSMLNCTSCWLAEIGGAFQMVVVSQNLGILAIGSMTENNGFILTKCYQKLPEIRHPKLNHSSKFLFTSMSFEVVLFCVTKAIPAGFP
jgi:hypothetical protein